MIARAAGTKRRAAVARDESSNPGSERGRHAPVLHEDPQASRQFSRTASISSREFNQDVGKAKRAAEKGPVTITDRGRPAFVLMKYEDYLRLSGRPKNLLDMLADDRPEADFDFEFPKLSDDMGLRIPDFSED